MNPGFGGQDVLTRGDVVPGQGIGRGSDGANQGVALIELHFADTAPRRGRGFERDVGRGGQADERRGDDGDGKDQRVPGLIGVIGRFGLEGVRSRRNIVPEHRIEAVLASGRGANQRVPPGKGDFLDTGARGGGDRHSEGDAAKRNIRAVARSAG